MKHIADVLPQALAHLPRNPTCFGINCPEHPKCQRYHDVATQEDRERIGRCEGKSLYIPIKEQAQ